MKRILALTLVLISCLTMFILSGCGDSTDKEDTSEAKKSTQADKEETKEYAIGETWEVGGQWKVTVNSVTETKDRNEFSDKNPGAVYLIDYTYENIGYKDDIMDGLYVSFDMGTIVDAGGKVGYTYPLTVTKYPKETPIGATCDAQCYIGVDNPGDFKITYSKYDSNSNKQEAVFALKAK